MNQEITVNPEQAGSRLDKLLVGQFTELSRSFLQKAIERGEVLVNGKKVAAHHFLKTNDKLTIKLSAPATIATTPNKNVNFKIIFTGNDYLIVDKPAGLVVHPAPGVTEPTLIDGLLARWPEIADVGEDKLRPGIVHRLDREVSGLLIVAKNNEMFNHLKNQFQAQTIEKEYTALVVGQMQTPSGTIDFPLSRSKTKHGKMAARPHDDEESKEAITHFEVVKLYKNFSLLKIKIDTGRTHQIRAHLSAFSHPVAGDKLYKPAKLKENKNLGRLFLHATALKFLDLTGVKQSYSSPLPPELNKFLENLI